MESIEDLEQHEVDVKSSNGFGYKNVLIPKSEVKKFIDLMEDRHKEKLDKKDKEIQNLGVEKDEVAKRLADLNNTLQKERNENAKNQETFENEKKILKKELEGLKEDLKNLQRGKEKLEEEIQQIQKEAISKIEEINAKNSKLEESLEKSEEKISKIEQDCKLELYKIYKDISKDFESYGIRSEDIYIFVATSAQVEVLVNILEAIKINASNNKDVCKEVEFFDKLFDSIKEYYLLERLCTQVGDDYDDKKHLKIDGDTRGKVVEVVVDGFIYKAKPYHSIVKVKSQK